MSYRYLGNKSRLVDWICEEIGKLVQPGAVIADLMCGTASVSEALARRGYSVIAADHLYFPVLHARARLLFSDTSTFKHLGMSYPDSLRYLNLLEPRDGLFSREYSERGRPSSGRPPRLYFSEENGGLIDAARHQIQEWRKGGLHDQACDLLLHDLILAVNRVANISGTYGYFRSTLSPASRRSLQLTPSQIVSPANHRVLHGSVFDTISNNGADLVYLDPPYTKRQYAGNYHILETIALEDDPIPVGDGGLRDWKDKWSPFCAKRLAQAAVTDAMHAATAGIVVWSYSDDGHIPLEQFTCLLQEFGVVTVLENKVVRYRSNSSALSGSVSEYLLICRR